MRRSLMFIIVLAMVWPAPGFAHALKVFATPVGDRIEGRTYFVGGGAAGDVEITLVDHNGDTVAETLSDSDSGTFNLPVSFRADFIVHADALDGHADRIEIAADRLPDSLPERNQAENVSAESVETAQQMIGAAVSGSDFDAAVARHTAPLAAQIDALENSLRVRDIIGGLGYLFGIFGLWALWRSRRKAAG